MSAAAESHREKGNEFFKAGKYAEACGAYDKALASLKAEEEGAATTDCIVKCRLNKAASLLKLQGYAAAGTEARAVLALDASNAKAHFRLGQAGEKLGDFATAVQSLTEAIKLNPSLREPRELLDAIKKRLKECPRLEQALQDMALVEERALRALNYADLKRARQQLELLLKDARANKETHWECRALLALALVCQDEGECEGAQDYVDAARRKLSAAEDRRAELYCLNTTALIRIDHGDYEAATPLLEGGQTLADEMGEMGLSARFSANLALTYTLSGRLAAAVEHGTKSVESARERGDIHFEAVASTNLAHALRLSKKFQAAAEPLETALGFGETLGYAHVISAALRQFALLQLENGRSPARVAPALEKLERARMIASANGLRRAACDDGYNKYAACLRYSYGTRAEALAELAKLLQEAMEIGYKACRVRLLLALGLGHLRNPQLTIGSWTNSQSDVEAAEAYLDQALRLVSPGCAAHAEVRHSRRRRRRRRRCVARLPHSLPLLLRRVAHPFGPPKARLALPHRSLSRQVRPITRGAMPTCGLVLRSSVRSPGASPSTNNQRENSVPSPSPRATHHSSARAPAVLRRDHRPSPIEAWPI